MLRQEWESIMPTSIAHEESQLEELPRRLDRPAFAESRSWIWVAIAALLLMFSNGANNIPLAAWLAPVFLMRFVRSRSLKIGLPIAYAVLTAAFAFQFRGMVPIPGVGFYIFLVVWGIPLVLPYIIDRLLAHRLTGLMASLVFPATWAATEYLASLGPFATWGSTAYS